MSIVQKMFSLGIDSKLFSLGIFPQEDGSIAVAEKNPKFHEAEAVYIEKLDSLIECVKYLNKELDEEKGCYLSIWKNLEKILDQIIEKGKEKIARACFSDDLRDMFLYRLIQLCEGHECLSSASQKLDIIDENSDHISDPDIRILGYFSTILQYSYFDLCVENERLEDIKEILDEYGEYEIRKMLKIAYNKKPLITSQLGYHGLNNLYPENGATPYGRFDYQIDRVMDGTGINDRSGGHATEKFLEYNKFRRHPELLMKKNFKYRVKPLRYVKRRLDCKKNKKKRKNKGLKVTNTGLVYVSAETDPQYYYLWDQQRNNPYSFDSRSENGVYPSWDTYKS
jgi:hypothetical protein